MAETKYSSVEDSTGSKQNDSISSCRTSSASWKFDVETNEKDIVTFLTGWRLHLLNLALCLGLFLSLLETTIMSTSLLAIVDELHESDRSTWIVTAYLLTYTGFIIPLTKISDIYGRKPVLLFSIAMFIAASAGAGWSHSMAEICIFRAFQGIGGGGIFGLTFVTVPEMVPRSLANRYSVIISSAFAMGNLLGPILGGVINNHGSWRWIFWLNLPGGVITFLLCLVSMPTQFPYHNHPVEERPKYTLASLARIDWLGVSLILAATCLLVAALEIGGTQYSWSSATPVSLLTISVVCWVLLVPWQWFQSTRRNTVQEPVLPWRILTDRYVMGILLNALCFGAAFFSVVINLPLRFQIVDGLTPLDSAYRLLAVTLVTPIGSILAGTLTQKRRVPALYMLIAGGALQTLGLALFTGLDAGQLELQQSMYAFEVIIGLGFGATLNTALIAIPVVCDPRDVSVGMGFIGQFRALGGSIGIAACANLLNHVLAGDLADLVRARVLRPEQVVGLQSQIMAAAGGGGAATASNNAQLLHALTSVYADSFKQEMWLITGFCAACVLCSLLLIERKPRVV